MVWKFVVGFVLFVGAVLFNGYVLLRLWAWFVVPFGLPPLTLPWAIGLSIIVSMAKGWPEGTSDPESPWFTLLKPYISATVYLALGWIVHGFM